MSLCYFNVLSIKRLYDGFKENEINDRNALLWVQLWPMDYQTP